MGKAFEVVGRPAARRSIKDGQCPVCRRARRMPAQAVDGTHFSRPLYRLGDVYQLTRNYPT